MILANFRVAVHGKVLLLASLCCGSCENVIFVPEIEENEPSFCAYCGARFVGTADNKSKDAPQELLREPGHIDINSIARIQAEIEWHRESRNKLLVQDGIAPTPAIDKGDVYLQGLIGALNVLSVSPVAQK